MDGKIAKYLAIAAISMSLVAVSTQLTTPAASQEEEVPTGFSQVIVPLDAIKLGPGQFLLVADTTPFASEGHVVTILPCDADGISPVKFVAGIAPNVAPVELGIVPELSKMGDTCVYHGEAPEGTQVTDYAIINTSDMGVRFGDNHVVTVFITELYSLGS